MEREEACAISDDNEGCGEFRDENGLKRVSGSFLGVDRWGDGISSADQQFERYRASAKIFEITIYSNLKVILGKCLLETSFLGRL